MSGIKLTFDNTEKNQKRLRFEMETPLTGFHLQRGILSNVLKECRNHELPPGSNVGFGLMICREDAFDLKSPFVLKVVFERPAKRFYLSKAFFAEAELAQIALDSFAAALSFREVFETGK